MAQEIKNPWVGLQTYTEGQRLYGRDEDIRNLSQYVLTDSETVLFGKSGIGKSSVLNAGVIPVARMKGITPIIIRLSHGQDAEPYIEQIYNKITASGISCGSISSAISFWELLHGQEFVDVEGNHASVLLIFDQFEEVFTLQQNNQKKIDFFHQLADVINDIMPNSLTGSSAKEVNGDKRETITFDKEEKVLSFDDLDFRPSIGGDRFYSDNDIHLVFTLREDFLSEFEYYTASIPSLKQHRYGLRPINEEQAADIIQKPCPGLVSQDVAKIIIEKVANRTDFKLDGKPEIEVDAAVLSLYLNKLYDKSKGEAFTEELVEKEAGNIIKEFYNDCIAGLPDDFVERLENILVNKEGHRENKSYIALSDELNGKEYIDKLIESKLLRTFKYANETKVEFVHDVLCSVIKDRKEQQERRKQEEQEKKRLQVKNRIKKIQLYAVSVILVIAIIFICVLLTDNMKLKDEQGFGEKQELALRISEDPLVIADNEYWQAHLLLIAKGDNRIDTIFNKNINKGFRDSTLRFEVDSIKQFYVNLNFGQKRNKRYYKDIVIEKTIGFFTQNKELKLSVEFDNSKMIKYSAHVIAKLDEDIIKLENAVIVLRDKIARTDNEGVFTFLLEDSLTKAEKISVVRPGFSCNEYDVFENGILRNEFILVPTDSLSAFKLKCEEMDSIRKWVYTSDPSGEKVGVRIKIDGKIDRLIFNAKNKGSRPDGKYTMIGYYYLKSEYDKYEANKKYMAYHLFSGWIDSRKQTGTGGVIDKPFEVESYDKVGNMQKLSGYRNKTGQIKGFLFKGDELIGKIGKNIDE